MGIDLVVVFPIILLILIGKGDAQCNSPHTNVDEQCEVEAQSNPQCSPARVFGGIDASNSRHPYLVSLQSKVEDGFFRHICTATMIADRVALTAAHCLWVKDQVIVDMRNKNEFEGKLKSDLFAAVGPYCRHMKGSGRLKVIRFYMHPGYQGKPELGNDIAVLVLDEGLNYDQKLATYKGTSTLDLESKDLEVLGWGATTLAEKSAQTFLENVRPLQQATLQFRPTDTCSASISSSDSSFNVNSSTMLCAYNANADTCTGDSGGPLLFVGDTDYQVGITSWGLSSACDGLVGLPGVYTAVAYYEDWIDGVLEKISTSYPELQEHIQQVLTGTYIPSTSTNGSVYQSSSNDIHPDCLLEVDYGNGEGFFPSYYFSATTGQCVEFAWTGLRFNANNFKDQQECEKKCPTQLIQFSKIGLN
eukprot:TRINITY_DN1143_c0_g1_i3.p1 TRINITY_DN1143_c0_g1~~TRINITY_DN1143_c0_g1_i3.p1  ORF type:complete len:418 (+),score=38.17 TRINITY_DN1143_c0_g1_i3:132-1385(+)